MVRTSGGVRRGSPRPGRGGPRPARSAGTRFRRLVARAVRSLPVATFPPQSGFPLLRSRARVQQVTRRRSRGVAISGMPASSDTRNLRPDANFVSGGHTATISCCASSIVTRSSRRVGSSARPISLRPSETRCSTAAASSGSAMCTTTPGCSTRNRPTSGASGSTARVGSATRSRVPRSSARDRTDRFEHERALAQQPAGRALERVTGIGELHPPADAMEEAHADLVLEPADALRQRGLRHPQRVRRPR